MLKGRIEFTGKTLGDVEEAVSEAMSRIMGENTSRSDSNEDSAFTFTVTGTADAFSDQVPRTVLNEQERGRI